MKHTSKIKSEGWMVVYNNLPFFPYFETRKEAREYNKWKTSNNGKVVYMKETSTTTYTWKQHGNKSSKS
jgi:hypothetical protein